MLNLTPGPDTVYILGRSIAQGRRAGVASALGICVGSIFHTIAAAFGLSALLATSAWAFSAVKLAGAAYLIFLGLRALLQRGDDLRVPAKFRESDPVAAFRQGILTNVLNPKVALFFLAFLPQFIDSAAPSKSKHWTVPLRRAPQKVGANDSRKHLAPSPGHFRFMSMKGNRDRRKPSKATVMATGKFT